jgi:pimeloyl-ACP methyl ester carboxylesterase
MTVSLAHASRRRLFATMTSPSSSQPRDSQTIALPDGRTLGFAEFGAPAGYPVVYFHGFPASRLEAIGVDLIARRRNLRILALDRPGFGLSSPQPRRRLTDWPKDVSAFTHHVGLSRFAVIGGSGGGPYAIACAAELPQGMVSRVGVMAGAPPWAAGTKYMSYSRRAFGFMVNWLPGFTRILLSGVVGTAKWIASTNYVKKVLDNFIEKTIKEKPDVEREEMTIEQRRERLMRVLFDGFAQGSWATVQEAQLLSGDWGIKLEDIDYSPIVVWHGAGDKNAPIEMVQWMVSRMPTAELRIFEDKSHYAMADNIEQILSELVTEKDIADWKESS